MPIGSACRAYEELKTEWPDATEEEQDHSLRIVRAGNYHGGSYEALEAYLRGYHNMHQHMEKLIESAMVNEVYRDTNRAAPASSRPSFAPTPPCSGSAARSDRRDNIDHYRNLTACPTCALKPRCTPDKVNG